MNPNARRISLDNLVSSNTELKRSTFIVLGYDSDGNASVSKKPRQHPDLTSASNEAERLARTTPGKSFTVLEVKGTVQVTGVQWK